jgi:hypothetical protein
VDSDLAVIDDGQECIAVLELDLSTHDPEGARVFAAERVILQ